MRKRDDKAGYTKEMDDNVQLMFNLMEEALASMKKQLMAEQQEPHSDEFNRSENIENEINNFRNQLKMQNLNDVNEQKYGYQASVTYMDMINECEKMGDYIINVVEALDEEYYN